MHEKIDVNFKMIITNNGQNSEVQFYEKGQRYHKNEKTFIRFKEPSLDKNNEYNQIMLICDNNEILIIRSGLVKMRQKYIENEMTIGYYNNEYVTSEITAYTNKYNYSDHNIFLDYNLILDNNIVGNYKMEVLIKGVEGYE